MKLPSLLTRQTELKEKLNNPIFDVKYQHHLQYVFLFLKNRKLIRISHSVSLDLHLPPQCDEIRIFPFPTLDLANAFDRRVRYFFKTHSEEAE